MRQPLENQKGIVHLLFLVVVLIVISFFVLLQTSTFKNTSFTDIFSRGDAYAANSAPTTVKIYSQAGDGRVGYFGSLLSGCTQTTWNTGRSASSGIADSTSNYRTYFVGSGCVGNIAISLSRGFLAFDTSKIPANATISSAKVGIFIRGKLDNKNDGNDFISVVQGLQASTTSLQAADYPKAGNSLNSVVEGSARVDITGMIVNGYTVWNLNNSGIGWINKGGTTKLAMREGHDILNIWSGFTNGQANSIDAVTSEYAGTVSDPYLEVTYTYPLPSTTPTPTPSPSPISSQGVNVKNFGALGDGIQDDAPKIQAALNSLPANGGTIYIPAGTYMLGTSSGGVEQYPNGTSIQSALIINKPNVVVQGDGANSILKLMPSKKMRIISVTTQNATIQKLMADGNKSQRNGTASWPNGDVVDALIYGSSTSSGMSVKNCEVKNGIEDGIGFWQSPNATVDTCNVHDNGTTQATSVGVAISGSNSTGGKVINSTIFNNSSAGVWLAFGSSSALVQNNTISNNLGPGITTGGDSLQNTTLSTGHQILDNTVSGNGNSGFNALVLLSSQNGTVSNNTITNNYYGGLVFDDNGSIPTSGWTVNANTCSNTNSQRLQDMGIRVLGLSSGINLTGNICENNGTSIDHQIQVINSAAVNSNWQSVNTITYTAP